MPDILTEGPVKANIPSQRVELTTKTQPPLDPTTTAQEDLTTAGQRRINLIWEYTQAMIALIVVATTMSVSALTAYYQNRGMEGQVPNLIAVAFGTVVGFYFSRTNHAAIGGIGKQPTQEYQGR